MQLLCENMLHVFAKAFYHHQALRREVRARNQFHVSLSLSLRSLSGKAMIDFSLSLRTYPVQLLLRSNMQSHSLSPDGAPVEIITGSFTRPLSFAQLTLGFATV